MRQLITYCICVFLLSCKQTPQTLFSQLEYSGISFTNELIPEPGFDVFRYRNYYNGGGVGIGDFDNDGLSDVYLISNQRSNRLYRNLGNFQFEDITDQSKAGGSKPWSTGVAIADINGDGWLDIYVCNSGDLQGNNRGNELFINNHDGTFTELAESYGLADDGFSTHAAFFDFDQDGDLDCYVLNNSFRPVESLPIENIRGERDKNGGDKFYLNDSGKFTDLSDSVGVFGSVIGFGLGITLLDVNGDSWTDIYVSNDFFERDYLYVNQKGNYFTEELESYFDQVSLFSMGADAADINNDGNPELFVTDMLPPSRERLKQTTMFDSYDFFNLKKRKGFYNQFMKNSFQLNGGNGSFSEIGRYSGMDATDWSWGTLIFDMDNDGLKEVFITNGIYKDVTDQDFVTYLANEHTISEALWDTSVDFKKFIDLMPSNPLSNYVFKLDTLLKYENMALKWGLATPSFSNGAAYGDLDNDGDLDLIVNNVNQPTFVYRNNSELKSNNYVSILLSGKKGNSQAIGTEIKVYCGEEIISYSHYPTRGFQSSMDYKITIGLGKATQIDSIELQWDQNNITNRTGLGVNRTYQFSYEESLPSSPSIAIVTPSIFTEVPFNHRHVENSFVDFDRERLLYHQLSKEGPALAKGDINQDGLDDFYIGGASGSSGVLYLNDGKDVYLPQIPELFKRAVMSEDVDAKFFDADNDGDLDLFVVSGGNEFENGASFYADRLYLNLGMADGKIAFKQALFPAASAPGSCVRPCDFDQDGDIDLFVGGRSIPGKYGLPADSYLYENDGSGKFTEVSAKYISQLNRIGLVTDAVWMDYDLDDDQDLFIIGEWMPVMMFENRGDFFRRKHDFPGFENTEGLYYSIHAKDANEDGFPDLIIGGLGENTMFRPTIENPIQLYVGDLDKNGSLDQIYTFSKEGIYYPYHVRNELNFQLSFIKKKFPNFSDYAGKSMTEIFTEDQVSNTIQLLAYDLSSKLAINNQGQSFTISKLPMETQFSPIFELVSVDFDGGSTDLIALGNFFATRPEESVYDANHGLVMSMSKEGITQRQGTGLRVRGAVRGAEVLIGKQGRKLVIAKNDDYAQIYTFK